MAKVIGPANAAVAKFDGLLTAMPNTEVLLSPLTTQEAVLSSKIEGTQATIGEVLEFEADAIDGDPTSAKRADILEVLSYRKALNHAVGALKDLPLSERVIRDSHRVLMQGVRGRNKSPGEYRATPNWIGPQGCTVEQARFVPPPVQLIAERMSELANYMHASEVDVIVQLAVVHAEFEAIHPFLDGNGRLGRLIVPLFLVHKKILSGPNFYISEYLELHRDEYYARLLRVSQDDDWTGWCEFFLKGVLHQGEQNVVRAKAILDLYRSRLTWFAKLSNSMNAIRAVDWFLVARSSEAPISSNQLAFRNQPRAEFYSVPVKGECSKSCDRQVGGERRSSRSQS